MAVETGVILYDSVQEVLSGCGDEWSAKNSRKHVTPNCIEMA